MSDPGLPLPPPALANDVFSEPVVTNPALTDAEKSTIQVATDDSEKVVVTARRRPAYLQYPLLNQEKQLMWITFEEVDLNSTDVPVTQNQERKKKSGFDIGQKMQDIKSLASRQTGTELYKSLSTIGCAVYLPGSIGVSDGADYSNENLNFIGSSIMNSLRGSGAGATINASQLAKAAEAAMESISDPVVGLMEGLHSGTVSTDSIVKLIQTVKVLPLNIGGPEVNGITAGLRRTANPHTHAIFNSVAIRSFKFSWQFIPTDAKEADQARGIIDFFRRNLYPSINEPDEYQNDLANADFFTYRFPTMLRVKIGFIDPRTGEFKTQLDDGRQFAFKIKDCYIKSVSVVFDDENSMTIHPDGHFVSARLEVELTEETTLTKRDIEDGF